MKHKCLKETIKKISPNPSFPKRGTPDIPHFNKGGRGGIFQTNVLNNEKGIALFMVLVLSVILLSITAAVLYMVIEGTQSSGREKRYKTALEASQGGLDVSYDLVASRGNIALLPALDGREVTTPATCVPNPVCDRPPFDDDYDGSYTGITTKLRVPTSLGADSCWSADCDSTLTIDPGENGCAEPFNSTYDMCFKLGSGLGSDRKYDVFVKIVDTTLGWAADDTDWDQALGVEEKEEGKAPKIDFLYTIEVLSQAQDNPMERARAEVLYGY